MTGLPGFARIIRHQKFFSACVILSLGVGISSASGVIAILDSLRFGPLPFRNADRVEHLYGLSRLRDGVRTEDVPSVVYRALRAPGAGLEDVAAYTVQNFQVRDGDRAFNAWGSRTTANFPQLLGDEVTLGRAYDPTAAALTPCVMLSYRFWRSELGADSGVIGRTLELNGTPHQVIGVASARWDFPEHVTMWASSLDPAASESRGRRFMVIAKRGPGTDAAAVRARIIGAANAAVAGLLHRRPNETIASASFREFARLRLGGIIMILGIIGVLVGFLTAVNFAALILARGIRRRGELGVRAALGASVPRMVRDILAESVLLCALGGLLAGLLSPAVVAFVRGGFTDIIPAWLTVAVSWRSIAASAALATLLGMVFALGPALDIARPALAGFLHAASSTVADAAGLARTRSWVVGIQVALASAVLITLGAVMGRALLMRTPEAGFDYQPLIVGSIADSGGAGGRAGRLAATLAAIGATPGVASAAYLDEQDVDPTRLAAEAGTTRTTAEEAGLDAPWLGRTGAGFFGVMRPHLAQGRFFSPEEESRGAPVAIVSRVVAHAMFGDAAIGNRIRLGRGEPLTVVGVIEDIRLHGYQPDPTAAVFVPAGRADPDTSAVTWRRAWVRTSGPLGITARLVQRTQARMAVQVMASDMADEVAAFRSAARLTLAIFAVALALAALGIYGLVSYTAELRNRELAIREALGATRLQVAGIMLRGALAHVVTGCVAGMALGIIVVDYLKGFQLKITTIGVATTVTFAAIALTVLVSSIGPLVATWRRDLSVTLRSA